MYNVCHYNYDRLLKVNTYYKFIIATSTVHCTGETPRNPRPLDKTKISRKKVINFWIHLNQLNVSQRKID